MTRRAKTRPTTTRSAAAPIATEVLAQPPESVGSTSRYDGVFDGRIHRVRLSSCPGVNSYETLRVNFYVYAKRRGVKVRVWNDSLEAGEPAVAVQAYLPAPQEQDVTHGD